MDLVDRLQDDFVVVDFAEALQVGQDLILNCKFMLDLFAFFKESYLNLIMLLPEAFDRFMKADLLVRVNRILKLLFHLLALHPAVAASPIQLLFFLGLQVSQDPLEFEILGVGDPSAHPAPMLGLFFLEGGLADNAVFGLEILVG